MKFSMIVVAVTVLAGVQGFGVSPSFAVRQVRFSCSFSDAIKILGLSRARQRQMTRLLAGFSASCPLSPP
jgi:ABC-type proline/glycine betaine transport system permease subunit